MRTVARSRQANRLLLRPNPPTPQNTLFSLSAPKRTVIPTPTSDVAGVSIRCASVPPRQTVPWPPLYSRPSPPPSTDSDSVSAMVAASSEMRPPARVMGLGGGGGMWRRNTAHGNHGPNTINPHPPTPQTDQNRCRRRWRPGPSLRWSRHRRHSPTTCRFRRSPRPPGRSSRLRHRLTQSPHPPPPRDRRRTHRQQARHWLRRGSGWVERRVV